MFMRAVIFFSLMSCSLLGMHNLVEKRKPEIITEVIPISGTQFTVFTNHSLHQLNQNVDRIIVAVQGNKRDARARVSAVAKAGKHSAHKILIISPQFKIEEDKPRSHEPYWKNSGWKQGDKSQDPSHLSSFAVLDEIITKIITGRNFPNITKIFVSGHSAGGQVAQRYALTTGIVERFSKINFSFLIMNPSSYAYLDSRRPYTAVGDISGFNNYKYGLDNVNAYGSRFSPSQLRDHYLKRKVIYVLGQLDNDPRHAELDLTPPAMMQGIDRLSRGRIYFSLLNHSYPTNNHQLIEVPGVGHEAEKIYAARDVKEILFSH